MYRRSRTHIMAVVAVGALLAAPLLATTSASAAIPGHQVLFISNSAFSDTGQEDEEVLASIGTTDAEVTVFDGGDGSAAAWTAALAGIDVLVIPEAEIDDIYVPGGTSVMSDGAAAVVKSWVTAGGDIVGLGAYTHVLLVSYLTGLDYTTVWADNYVGEGEWLRQAAANASWPTAIPNVNYSGGLIDFDTWPAGLAAPVTPWYLSEDGTNLGVASFAIGAGSFVYVGYDWFPDGEDIGSGARALWDTVLQSFFAAPVVVPPVAPEGPELAATGVDLGIVPIGSVLLVLGLIALSVARLRSAQRA
ncbi:MAG TPA: hypothetical protein VIQ78_05335 [Terrimesophilobacter sp.]|uniref:hypothetical protein n=1 Tax=Terrimesophilobacter sp. TaxID=2906435 RepID=UPI002F95C6E2